MIHKTIHLESHWEEGFKLRVAFCGAVRRNEPVPGLTAHITEDSSIVNCVFCLRKGYEHFRGIADKSTQQIAYRSRRDRQLADLPEREKPY